MPLFRINQIYITCLGLFCILSFLICMPSYAASEPEKQAAQQAAQVRESMVFMDILDGELSAKDRFAEVVNNEYKLGTGDVVSVKIYNEAELSGQFRVNALGQILMPLIGTVNVLEKTAIELANEIEGLLKDGYLRRPSVTIEIVSFRPFYLLGEVRTPGHYSYAYGLNVIKAVAIAGGFTYRANQKKIMIKRDFNGVKKVVEAHAESPIYPGDVITVKERFF